MPVATWGLIMQPDLLHPLTMAGREPSAAPRLHHLIHSTSRGFLSSESEASLSGEEKDSQDVEDWMRGPEAHPEK